MVAAKPDCTGQKFGMLTAIGRGHKVTRPNGKIARTWKLKCDCGTTVYLVRCYFDRIDGRSQKSCGCLGKNRKGNVDNKRRPENKAGQRFGNLVAIEMLPIVRENGASIWKCQCDCGNIVNLNAKRLNAKYRLNCGDETRHQFGLVYPPTPSPYPEAAGEVVAKYLNIATAKHRTINIDSQIEDERMNRLIRAAWIITYRREQGEELSELFEKRYIWKYLRHAKEAIRARIARQNIPIRRYTRDDLNNQIGIGMTNAIFPRVAESIFEPVDLLPENKPKRYKFKTC
jgi:hypothetical protein